MKTPDELKNKFQRLEDELNGAYEQNDVKKIAALLSDNWTILESSTGLSDKKRFLQAIEKGALMHTKMAKEVQQVTLVENVAIVISKGKNEGRYSGEPYDSEQWVTNIYPEKTGTGSA